MSKRDPNRLYPNSDSKLTFYGQLINPEVREELERQLDQGIDIQLSLLEELALTRMYAARLVQFYTDMAAEAQKLPSDATHAEKSAAQKKLLGAGVLMHQALTHVADMADKAAKLRDASARLNGYTVHDVSRIIDKAKDLALQEMNDLDFEDANDKQRFEENFSIALATKLKIGAGQEDGSILTPDETAALFDNTIPSLEDDPNRITDDRIDEMIAAGMKIKDMLTMEGDQTPYVEGEE